MRLAGMLAAITICLYADSVVEGPRLGYVADKSTVRSVLGLVGAARLSNPVASGFGNVVTLAGKDAAFGTREDGSLVRVDLRSGEARSVEVIGVTAIAASPLGTWVLALAGDKAVMLASDGSFTREFGLAVAPAQVAVADEGSAAAIVLADTERQAISFVTAEGTTQVYQAPRIAAISYVPGTADLVFADGEGAIFRVNRDLQLARVATVPGTVAVAVSADGQRLLALAAGRIHELRFDGSLIAEVECPPAATLLRPISNSVFQLTDGNKGPIWVVDASAEALRVAFIPEAVNE